MNAESKLSANRHAGKPRPFWRNSTYDEPIWVSVAWIIGPIVGAAVAMYFALN